MFPDLLSLPIVIQLSLVSGYAAYHFAYVGIRDHHKTVDVAFITLAFGLIATAVFSSLVALEEQLKFTGTFPSLLAGLAAFIAALFSGFVWRKWGRDRLQNDLRNKDVTWSNDDPTALRTISSSTKFLFMQVAVELNDGTWLRCDDAPAFHSSPFGPFTLGKDGGIAMYITHVQDSKKNTVKELKTVSSDDWGERMTYIPANEIRRINFRIKKSS